MSELRIEYMPLAALQRWPRNPKRHNQPLLDDSVERFGFVQPLLIDEASGKLVAGHGRLELLEMMHRAGRPAPPRIVSENGDWLVPVIRGVDFRNTREAEAYLLADNRLVELGGWDTDELRDILLEYDAKTELAGIGVTESDLADWDTFAAKLNRELDAELEPDDDDERAPLSFPLFSSDEIIESAFEFYRARGFPYVELPLHVRMQKLNALASMSIERAKRFTHSTIADCYHPHRFAAHAKNKKSPLEAFDDDRRLRHALRMTLDSSNRIGIGYIAFLSLVLGTQAAANFRPGVALAFYRRFAKPGGIVLDPCTGYGGRLVGWIASQIGGTYVGCDPASETHAANLRLARELAPSSDVRLHNLPFEDADLSEYAESIDFALTSPPYFDKELYSDEPTQSRLRYPTFELWCSSFLDALIAKTYAALRPGGVFALNIDDVDGHPLANEAQARARAHGFERSAVERLDLKDSVGKGNQNSAEPIFLFRKPR